jgi:hypothetical protein
MLVGRVMGDMVILPMADLLLLNSAAKGCTSNPLLRLGINGSVELCLPPVLAPRVLDKEGHAGATEMGKARWREMEKCGSSGWGARREKTQVGLRKDRCTRWLLLCLIGWG